MCELFHLRISVWRHSFGAGKSGFAVLLVAELYRARAHYSNRNRIKAGIPGYFLIVSVGLYINFRDTTQAVVHAFVEQVLFGRTGEP
jgi:hypothetical protein